MFSCSDVPPGEPRRPEPAPATNAAAISQPIDTSSPSVTRGTGDEDGAELPELQEVAGHQAVHGTTPSTSRPTARALLTTPQAALPPVSRVSFGPSTNQTPTQDGSLTGVDGVQRPHPDARAAVAGPQPSRRSVRQLATRHPRAGRREPVQASAGCMGRRRR